MKRILYYAVFILLLIACRPGGDPEEQPQPQPQTNVMVHNGKSYKLTKNFVYVDTVYGRFYNEHLYSYSFLLLSDGFSVMYDSTDFTEFSGKGDAASFDIISDQDPPKDGSYVFSEDEGAGKLMYSFLALGYDEALDSSEQEIETASGSTLKFAAKNPAKKEYRLEVSTPAFQGAFEGPFVIFKDY